MDNIFFYYLECDHRTEGVRYKLKRIDKVWNIGMNICGMEVYMMMLI